MRSLVLSQVAVTAVLAVTGAAAMVGLAYGGFEMAAPGSIVGVVVGFALGVFAFAAFGVLLGSVMPTARAAQGLGLLLFFGTFFLVGGGPPPSLLPDALNSTMAFTPLGQLVDAIRGPWTTGSWDPSALVALGAIAVVAATLCAGRLAAAGER